MYFNMNGVVAILSTNEESIIKKLEGGTIFGEMALLAEDSRRFCSIMATTLTQVYILKKKNLKIIFESFPKLLELFKKESDKRKE